MELSAWSSTSIGLLAFPGGLKALIAEGANVKARSRDAQTLLLLSANNNPNPEVLRLLLSGGAGVNDAEN